MASFIRRERKHRRLAKQKELQPQASGGEDSNIAEIVSLEAKEKEARRRALHQDLSSERFSANNGNKKRKRLDKYIDTKLRKEENLELLKKLAAQQVDTSLLQSSKRLGRSGQESKRERFRRVLNEKQSGLIDDAEAGSVLYQARRTRHDESDASSELGTDEAGAVENGPSTTTLRSVVAAPRVALPSVGSGLKRPLALDEHGRPVITQRKRRKRMEMDNVVLNFDRNDGVGSDELTRSSEEESADSSDFDHEPNSPVKQDPEDEDWEGFSSDTHDATALAPLRAPMDMFPEDESVYDETETTSEDEKSVSTSAFKAWADSQRNAALDFTPSSNSHNQNGHPNTMANQAALAFKPRDPSPDPLPNGLAPRPSAGPGAVRRERSTLATSIPRLEHVQESRLRLPVVQEEQRIVEAIDAYLAVILCASTGSGKTTQVPQLLLENGYGSLIGLPPAVRATSHVRASSPAHGMIAVTQPRRVAATTVASRVAEELGPSHRHRVAHQVRYDSDVSTSTAIKFMTDGILIREIQQDFTLSRYSVVVLDEVHERGVNTDLLIGLLSRIIPLRSRLAEEQPDKYYPLKLVIMSATMEISSLLESPRLFKDSAPPVLQVEGRQYNIMEHFARRTRRDYVEEVVDKVSRGHRKLPPGAMLVFMTGADEIRVVERKLAQAFSGREAKPHDVAESFGQRQEYFEAEIHASDEASDSEVEIDMGDNGRHQFAHAGEDHRTQTMIGEIGQSKTPLEPHILPLYAALPAAQQQKVFQPPPEGSRLIVLATNVAETSLTIPNVKYVFDTGRSKRQVYDVLGSTESDPSTSSAGVQRFEIDWISKASAEQRKGRAGRTAPGHVWRLYSSAIYEQCFPDHETPEIQRIPLESVVLQLKSLSIENVIQFPFPSPPDSQQLAQAESLLHCLGALERRGTTKDGRLTELGRELVSYPLSPRFGKIISLARKNGVLAHAIAVVAALAVGQILLPEPRPASKARVDDPNTNINVVTDSEDEHGREQDHAETVDAKSRSQAYHKARAILARWDDHSDACRILTAVAAHAEAESKSATQASEICGELVLREKGMAEIQKLRQQLHRIATVSLYADAVDAATRSPWKLSPPTQQERIKLDQVIASGFIDQVVIRADLLGDVGFGRKPKRSIEVAYRTLVPTIADADLDRSEDPSTREVHKSVFVHPSSVLSKLSVNEMPPYIVYSHLSRAPTVALVGKMKKTRFHPLTAIGTKALASLAEGSPLLVFGKPIGKIEELSSQKRQCWVGVSLKALGTIGDGWPLGAWKVVEKRNSRGEWHVEKVVAR